MPGLVEREKADLVIANAENAAGGMGVDIKSAKELLSAGVHVLTSGNHIWKKKEIYSFLDEHETLIRPANFPAGAPGRGWCFWRHDELRAVIINLQGRVFMVFGTHTHVPTADERILPNGTAYITDVGMCGPLDSVIGMEREIVIEGFRTQLPRQFEVAKDNVALQGIITEIDEKNGRAREIRRLRAHWQATSS